MRFKKTVDSWDPKALTKKLKETSGSELDEFLVIGIDFGTTYSGVAWATAADFANDHVNLITTWDDREETKVPSTLSYKNGNVNSWGYADPEDGAQSLVWLKLLLLRDEDLPDEIRRSGPLLKMRRDLARIGKKPVEAISDYLKSLWKYALKMISKARSAAVLEALRLHVVLTVPASWKDYARHAMRRAAERAGITHDRAAGPTMLTFAIEPEAAAFATIWEKERHLKTDEVYMVCDAGGGTVDIITYRVGKLNPLELHEAVAGEAGLCGGVFIDQKFHSMCRNRLGFLWKNLSPTGIKDIMKTEWEYAVKTTFTSAKENKKYIISIPAEAFDSKADMDDTSREPHIKNGRIHFSCSDIKQVFAESFGKIEGLIARQISESTSYPVTAVILVGGLGSSPYLYEYLSSKFHGIVEVLQANGPKPRSAICRGAVYKGFMDRQNGDPDSIQAPMSVASTIARFSLGVNTRRHFIPGYDREQDKIWDSVEGVWMADNQMTWYLKKGQVVDTTKSIRHPFYRAFKNEYDFRNGVGVTKIMQCESDSPPARCDSSVTVLGSIRWQIDHINFEDLEFVQEPNGHNYCKIHFDTEMVPSGASTLVTIFTNDKKLGVGEWDINLI